MPILSHSTIRRLYDQGLDAILRLVTKLENQIEDLQAQLTHHPQPRIAALSKELALAKRTLAHQSQALLQARQLNHQLTRRLRELEHELEGTDQPRVERDSHNSSLPPALDPPWKKVNRTRSLRQQSGRKAGGQPGHRGATLKQTAHPDHVIIHAAQTCLGCGSALDEAGVVTSECRQVFDLPPVKMIVTEHRREARRCPACGAATKGQFPQGVLAPTQYGPSVLARSAYLNLYQLLPAARTAEALRDLFGCSPSPAIVQRAGQIISTKLVRTEQRIKAALRDSAVIGADETGLRVAGQGGYVHVARTAELTHYAYDERRGKAAMDEIGILPQFGGTLVRDGWASYQWYGHCRHGLCNAHLLRDLVFVAETDPAQEVWTKPLSELLIEIKEAAAKARRAGDSQLSEEMKSIYLGRYNRLVKKADQLNPHPPRKEPAPGSPQPKRPPLSPARKLINRLQRRADEVLRFMSDLAVPFDNNGSERDLRMVKLQQKIGGCFRTKDGANSFCRVRSYLSTARKQGHALLRSLERVLSGKPLTLPSPSPDTG